MNKRICCYDVVNIVTDEATKQFSYRWKENEECKKILKQYCGVIDSLADDFGGKYFEVGVDDMDMTISIKMECPDCRIDSIQHNYYKLIQKTVAFGFSHSEEGDGIILEFVFPSIWNSWRKT